MTALVSCRVELCVTVGHRLTVLNLDGTPVRKEAHRHHGCETDGEVGDGDGESAQPSFLPPPIADSRDFTLKKSLLGAGILIRLANSSPGRRGEFLHDKSVFYRVLTRVFCPTTERWLEKRLVGSKRSGRSQVSVSVSLHVRLCTLASNNSIRATHTIRSARRLKTAY